mmetsp:Transcript_26554/g.35517  ORF Transcript_26554/g.35517 Transcript_26554/m.35517 type:complete len:148 (+) Transcript_26554:98-541(+)
MANRHIQNRASYGQVKSDPSKNLTITMGEQDGIALSVITMKGEGLTIDDFRAFSTHAEFAANMTVLESAATCRNLDNEVGEGIYAMYQHIKTPMIVSNRCIFMSVQTIELENGGFIHLCTSKGMKPVEQANVALQGKDVLCHTVMTF